MATKGALALLSPHLYASTFILSDDTIAVQLWLRHYISIGVRPSHVKVAIRTRKQEPLGALNQTIAVLHTHGVGRGHVHVIHGENSSDLLRLQVINEHIGRVAESDPQAWYIYADVDEHFYYDGPAMRNLPQVVAKHDCFWGLFCDMRSANGNLTEMRADVPADVQYPIACRVRQLASTNRQRVNKVILFRIRAHQTGNIRDFRSPHALTEERDVACHFREWHSSVIGVARAVSLQMYHCRRGGHQPNAPPPLPPPQAPPLAWALLKPPAVSSPPPPSMNSSRTKIVAANRPSAPQCVALAGTVRHYALTHAAMLTTKDKADWDLAHPHTTWNDNACGTKAKNGACLDYHILYQWMRRQSDALQKRNATTMDPTDEDKKWCPNLPQYPYCFTMGQATANRASIYHTGFLHAG